MEFIRNFPFFSVAVFLFSAVICSVLKPRAARIWTVAAETAVLAFSACVLYYTWSTGEFFRYNMGHFDAPWSNQLRAGVLEGVAATGFSLILLLSHIGGMRYVNADIENKKQSAYCTLLNLIGAALMALAYTNDLFTGYVFLEIMTLSSCGILMIRRAGRTALAATRYMVINLLGSGLFLLGTCLFYGITGHLLMEYIGAGVATLDATGDYAVPLTVTIGLVCAGLAIKAGLFPFHTWMPDTYGTATPTSSAVLSGIVSKGYIFLLVKIMYRVAGVNTEAMTAARHILYVFGILGIILGSVWAMRSAYLNRMIAFSSAAQIGYIFVGIGLGGTAGFTAALFQLIAHGLTKPLLFLSGARLAESSGDSQYFADLQGAAHRNRAAGAAFTVAALSMVGIPLLAGFPVKLYFAIASVQHGILVDAVTLLTLAVSTLLNALYFIRTAIRIYTPSVRPAEKNESQVVIDKKSDPGLAVAAVGFALAIVSLGVFPGSLSSLITTGLSMFA